MDIAIKRDLHIAELLAELLATGQPMLLGKDPDGLYSGSVGRKHYSACDLEGMLEGLTDHPRAKVCRREGCEWQGRPVPLWKFGTDRESADGRASVCKSCEAKRVARHGKRKSAAVPSPDHQDQAGEASG